jgi:hypothetical protein
VKTLHNPAPAARAQPGLLGAAASLVLLAARPCPGQAGASERAVKVVPDAEPLTAAQLETTGFRPADSAGLFVGIRHFLDSDGKPQAIEVPFAADDAVDLAHFFVFELKLVTAPRVSLALSGEPEKAASRERLEILERSGARRTDARFTTILGEVGRARKAAGESGLLLLTFATHGYTASGTQLLLGQDSVLEFLDATGLPVERILDFAATSSAPRQIVLIDACRERVNARRSAGADPKASLSASFEKAVREARGMAVLCAATAGGYSYDDRKSQNGVFTAAVLRGLRGEAPHDERGFITPASLGAFVDREVKAWVRENVPGDGASRGISYAVDDLRSGTMPLAWKRQAVLAGAESAKRLLAVLKGIQSQHVTSSMVSEIAWAAGNMGTAALEPLTARLEKLERFGPDYAETLSSWWRAEGRRRFAPLGVTIGTRDGRTAYTEGEKFDLSLRTELACWLTVVAVDETGKGELLFPNPDRPSPEVPSGFDDAQPVLARPPYGKARCVAIATRHPLKLEGVEEADVLKGFKPLPRGLETRAALEDGSPGPAWLPLSKLLEQLSPSGGAWKEIVITTSRKNGGAE